MLKRYQVLLPEWLEDYFKIGVETYGFSFSEIIRLQICMAILAQIPSLHPEYKPNVDLQEILQAIDKATAEKPDKQTYGRFVSKIYFETRKAIEYRMQKLEKGSKG